VQNRRCPRARRKACRNVVAAVVQVARVEVVQALEEIPGCSDDIVLRPGVRGIPMLDRHLDRASESRDVAERHGRGGAVDAVCLRCDLFQPLSSGLARRIGKLGESVLDAFDP
jgi:hypothetical protein